MPADWAATQHTRADTLLALGVRSGGDEGLRAPREAIPGDWAGMQTSWAEALRSLFEIALRVPQRKVART